LLESGSVRMANEKYDSSMASIFTFTNLV
jgi:hypothetical protein